MPKSKSALNPVIARLGLVSFFADVSSEMLYPITPIFLTSVLGASMASVGLIEGTAEAISSLLKTYAGSWSDKIQKRKPFIVIGYALAALAKPIIGVSHSWGEVLFARGLDRTGKGLRTAPRDAMIADSATPEQRGAAFGWHRALDTLGGATGPLFAIWLLRKNPEDLRSLYFWALIPGFFSVAIILTIREQTATAKSNGWKNPLAAWRDMPSTFKRFVLGWGIFSLANSSDVFLLMKPKQSGMGTETVILLYCAFNLIYALTAPKLGQLSDSFGRKNLLMLGLGLFAFVYAGFAWAHLPWHFWALFLLYGLYMAATEGVGKAIAVDFSPPELKATGLGILGTVTGISTVIASTIAGAIWDKSGSTWPFLYGSLGALLALAVLFFVPRKQNT